MFDLPRVVNFKLPVVEGILGSFLNVFHRLAAIANGPFSVTCLYQTVTWKVFFSFFVFYGPPGGTNQPL
jgi:hypothetical protein